MSVSGVPHDGKNVFDYDGTQCSADNNPNAVNSWGHDAWQNLYGKSSALVGWLYQSSLSLYSGAASNVTPPPSSERVVKAVKSGSFLERRRVQVFSGALATEGRKDVPYLSNKYVLKPSNLNSKVRKNNALIYCRHLAAQFIISCRQNSSQVTHPHILFGSTQAIQKNISANIEDRFHELKLTASGKHIIVNDKFGKHLSVWAKSMMPGQKKWFLILSMNHAMAFQLHYELKYSLSNGSEAKYGIRFFDPNMTDSVVKCIVNNPADFNADQYALSKFINNSSYNTYFRRDGGSISTECLIYDCTDPTRPNPKFTTIECASPHGISATMLSHLLKDGGDASAIEALARGLSIGALCADELTKELSEKYTHDMLCLPMAMYNGNGDAIKAYCNVLENLSENQRAGFLPNLVAAKGMDGIPGLYMALQNGHASAIKAYGQLLKLLPKDTLSELLPELLSASRSNGISGLYMALQDGHTDAIKAYGDLLDLLPDNQRDRRLQVLLAAKREDGKAGICIAYKRGHYAAIAAYRALLNLLPIAIRDKYLSKLLETLGWYERFGINILMATQGCADKA